MSIYVANAEQEEVWDYPPLEFLEILGGWAEPEESDSSLSSSDRKEREVDEVSDEFTE